ncbi:hypothetical protein Pyn_37282 [Prunus yedoensis var. nudiflora]|uniref:Uncharacterized protein n=1 Tax=Prunus yedoensis var. nudiflora TaxID=2094558 RepID=A0A314XMZ3_PRUYE|nr:hypothetical protein Pyn_37282 [Prunus yedoensis var. nudiflora]
MGLIQRQQSPTSATRPSLTTDPSRLVKRTLSPQKPGVGQRAPPFLFEWDYHRLLRKRLRLCTPAPSSELGAFLIPRQQNPTLSDYRPVSPREMRLVPSEAKCWPESTPPSFQMGLPPSAQKRLQLCTPAPSSEPEAFLV